MIRAPLSFLSTVIVASLLLFSSITTRKAEAVPPNFQNQIILTNLNEPVAIEFLPDNRMVVVGRLGTIWLSLPSSGYTQLEQTPFLQLPNVSTNFHENGLFSITLDPDFVQNGHYYVFYTAESPQVRDRLSRFTAVGNTTDPSTQVILWEDIAAPGASHHGGALAFGPDGYLYFSVGEHEIKSNSQDLTTPRGKMLRLAKDGSIPTSNPFYDGAGPNYDAIWAYGLRNPFRMSFDPLTGVLYIGEVGGDFWNNAFEEVNVGVPGANYGWPLCEGTCSTPGVTSPIYSYSHNSRDASITGGFIYRGSQFPSSYYGSYFFGDYAQNWIRYLTFDVNGQVTGVVNFEPEHGGSDGPYGNITDLKEGPEGALYYVDYNYTVTGQATPGSIRRISYTGANNPPVVSASANPQAGTAPLSVAFSSAGTFDPEGSSLTYDWDFGDQASSTSQNPIHVYSSNGRYTALLSVSDGVNTSISGAMTINVGNSPQPTISTPPNGSTFRAGHTISFGGGATDVEDGVIPPSNLSWIVVFHHGTHTHPGFGTWSGVSAGSFQIPSTGHYLGNNTAYEIILFATDSDGIQERRSVLVYPQTVDLTFVTGPSGLTVNVDGTSHATPLTINSLIGFQHMIAAPNQSVGANNYTFDSWSDGGAQQHTITVPDTNRTFTAGFTSTPNSSLVGHWTFDEGSGTAASDSSGNGHHGTLVNNPTWMSQGKIGGAISLDGVDDYVDFGTFLPVTGGGARSVLLWLKPSSADVAGDVLGWGTAPNNLVWRNTTPHSPRLFANGNQCNSEPAGGNLTPDVWTHLAWTGGNDLNTYRMYKDGALIMTCTINSPVNTFGAGLEIGDNGDGNGGDYNTVLDDVRIYSRALTAQEVLDIYNAGSVPTAFDIVQPVEGAVITGSTIDVAYTVVGNPAGVDHVHFKLDSNAEVMDMTLDGVYQFTNVSSGPHVLSGYLADPNHLKIPGTDDSVSFTTVPDTTLPTASMTAPINGSAVSGMINVAADATDNVGVAGVQFLLDGQPLGIEDTSAPYSINWNTAAVGNGSHALAARARDQAGNQATSTPISVTVSNTPSASLIGHWTFDEGFGTVAGDSSGNNHEGNLINNPTWTSQGKIGGALSFDGVDDYVDFGTFLPVTGGGARSVSLWIKPIATDVAGFVLGWGTDPDQLNYRIANPHRPRIIAGGGNCSASVSLTPGVWNHIAFTGGSNLSTYRTYINGALITSCTTNYVINSLGTGLRINSPVDQLQSDMDDIRIYNRILSASEIQALFNGNPPQ